MSEQETSRSCQSTTLNVEVNLKATKDFRDFQDTQSCSNISSPDSGMGNTIFSSPEKSDKEGGDSLDNKDRDNSGRNSPGTPQRIRLARNNVYGPGSKGSPNSSKDFTSWNHLVNNASHLTSNLCALKCSDNAKQIMSPEEHNQGIFSSTRELQSELFISNDTRETSSGDECVKKVPDSRNELPLLDYSILTSKSGEYNSKAERQTVDQENGKALVGEESFVRNDSDKLEKAERKDLNIESGINVDASTSTKNENSIWQVTGISSELQESPDDAKKSDNAASGNGVYRDSLQLNPHNGNIDRSQEFRPTLGLSNSNLKGDGGSALENPTDANQKPSIDSQIRMESASSQLVFQPPKELVVPRENVLVEGGVVGKFTNSALEESGPTEKPKSDLKEMGGVEKIEVNCNLNEAKNLCHNDRLKPNELLDVNVNMGIEMGAIRDTDSEAGDSCCSEDQDMCEGENGCIHQDGVCNTDQNWDYLMDEEFNVPKKPILNGSAEQLERRSSLKRKATEEAEEATPTKCKRGIQFEGVTVFYFPRSQGFTCVPSQGGSTLGMSRRHAYIRQFSLAEHAVEQRRAHREYLLRLRQQRSARERGDSSSRGSSSEDSEENSEEASDLSDSELDADSYFFLQPLPIRQRRALLRQAGICHIEGLEKEECKDIRVSRELCGCQCKVYCDPDTCECAEAGIRCQVDRHNFPCGCSREGCGNTYGRIEFNPIRVRTHFIHTLMRLEIEKRQYQQQHQQHQQQQQWQDQQRAKWLATTSASTNGFSSGGGVAAGNLPFFDGSGREASALAVTDLNKFTSTVEMASCVGSMNTPLYPHFESRQMIGPGAPPPTPYVQQDSVGDFNSGTCSVFGGLGTTFDPASPYGACHSFPSSSVVPPQVVTPQVVPQVAPQSTPEPYNSLSKFANTANLVSTSFPYSGALVPVNCSNTHNNNNNNNFCVPGVHDNSAATVFGHYHEHGTVTQNFFKASINECSDFQPNFEAISSSSASPDKTIRYIPAAASLMEPSKDVCNDYTTSEANITSCSSVGENNYEMGTLTTPSSAQGHIAVGREITERQLTSFPVTSHSSSLTLDTSHIASSSKDITSPTVESAETTENLGEIVKKSIVETVSA
ncbi:uncharacterized protein [Palaemon carinicauda]